MNTPTREYGYILIDTEEKRKKFSPRLPTDERACPHHKGYGVWERSTVDSDTFDNACGFCQDCVWRRKIDPGEGWEIVPKDERLSKNFEWTRDGISWTQAGLANESLTVEQSLQLNDEYAGEGIVAFRRRKSVVRESLTTENDGWISASERFPSPKTAIWVWRNWAGKKQLQFWNSDRDEMHTQDNVLFWKYAGKEVPEPPKDPADVAFEEALKESIEEAKREEKQMGRVIVFTKGTEARARKMFNAGREFERSKGQP